MLTIDRLPNLGLAGRKGLVEALGRVRRSLARWESPPECKKTIRAIGGLIADPSVTDGTKDAAFVARLGLGLWTSYAKYWAKLRAGEFQESWKDLQDCIDVAGLFIDLNRGDWFHAKWLLDRCRDVERLYPHRLFASSEIIADVVCSICGADPLSPECAHRPGVLYGGRLMREVATKIHALPGISLTETPKDKRCIMMGLDHAMVRMFVGVFVERRESPLAFAGITWGERDGHPHADVVFNPMLRLEVR